VQGETGHVFAHGLIQHQTIKDEIALGQIPPQKAAIYKDVEVLDVFT